MLKDNYGHVSREKAFVYISHRQHNTFIFSTYVAVLMMAVKLVHQNNK